MTRYSITPSCFEVVSPGLPDRNDCSIEGWSPVGAPHAGTVTTLDDSRLRAWLRAPVEPFAEQFADDGPFGGLTQWVRGGAPALDLHLWSDVAAGVHRARVVSGTVGLIDVAWSQHRFQIAARRPFTRAAVGWLDSAWHPLAAAPARVLRAVAFGERARESALSRAGFGIAALTGLPIVTQEYAPLLTARLESAPKVAEVRAALRPAPVPGGEPFFSAAPDAVAWAPDGVLEFVRVFSARAPELRFAAAQAVVDLGLFNGLDAQDRAAQIEHFARISTVRRNLGLRAAAAGLDDGGARARILIDAGSSDRLRLQFDAVRERLIERGLLDQIQIVTQSVA